MVASFFMLPIAKKPLYTMTLYHPPKTKTAET